MSGIDAMATYEAKTAKKVYLYKNGSKLTQPKCMVVNDRQIRDFSTFLNRVTSGLRAPVAVRNIYTPKGGHPVSKLDDLCSGQYYVAGGNEQFKKVKYGGEDLSKSPRKPRNEQFFLPHRAHQIVIATSRYKLPLEKPFVIHMFRNGDEKYRGARILLPRKIMGSWEHVMELVTQKASLFTPAKRLCTLDGRTIHGVSEIQDGGKYVALEGSRSFQRVAYCATNEKTLPVMRSVARATVRMRHRSEPLTTEPEGKGGGGLEDTGNTVIPLASKKGRGLLKRRKSIRPMAGRKNKEGREKAIEDHREDSIFGGSPPHERELDESIRVARMPSPPLKSSVTTFHVAADGDKDRHSDNYLESSLEEPLTQIQEVSEHASEPSNQRSIDQARVKNPETHVLHPNPVSAKGHVEETQDGVFRAKEQHRDSLEAETVGEGGETHVEKPIDQEVAREVEEEVGTEADEGDLINTDQAKDIHLEPQPVLNSVDLSLQRASPQTTSSHTKLPTIAPESSRPSGPPSRHSVASQGASTPAKLSTEGEERGRGGTEEVAEEIPEEEIPEEEIPEEVIPDAEEVIPDAEEEIPEEVITEEVIPEVDESAPTPPPQESAIPEEVEDQT